MAFSEDVIELDADLENADWPKRTPDRMEDLLAASQGVKKVGSDEDRSGWERVEKYSPDQKRDYHGRFAYEGATGAPVDGFKDDPDEFEAVMPPQTFSPEKFEQAVLDEEKQFAHGLWIAGGEDGRVRVKASLEEMIANQEALYAQATAEEIAKKDWYFTDAGAAANAFFEEFKDSIPDLNKDMVVGILASTSGNTGWADKYMTNREAGGNQWITHELLSAWATNGTFEIDDLSVRSARLYVEASMEDGKTGNFGAAVMPAPGTYTFRDLAAMNPATAVLFYSGFPKLNSRQLDVSGNKPRGGPIGFGGLPGNLMPGIRMLQGVPPSEALGRSAFKIRSFYSNIARSMAERANDTNATIDIHEVRALLGKHSNELKTGHYAATVGTSSRYEMFRRAIAAGAALHGLDPKQYQAIVWHVQRRTDKVYMKQFRIDEKERKVLQAFKKRLRDKARRERLKASGATP